MDVETPLRHRRKTCHGRHCTYAGSIIAENPATPAITFLGEFDRLTYVNTSIAIEIHVADLDTPVERLVVHVEVSNDQLVRPSDVIEDGNGETRFLTIYPLPNAAGCAQLICITVQAVTYLCHAGTAESLSS